MVREKKSERAQRAIAEVETMIRERYPEAEFRIVQRPGDARIWVEAFTASETAGDVLDITAGRQTDILVEQGVALYVLPMPYDRRPSLQAAQKQPKPKSA